MGPQVPTLVATAPARSAAISSHGTRTVHTEANGGVSGEPATPTAAASACQDGHEVRPEGEHKKAVIEARPRAALAAQAPTKYRVAVDARQRRVVG